MITKIRPVDIEQEDKDYIYPIRNIEINLWMETFYNWVEVKTIVKIQQKYINNWDTQAKTALNSAEFTKVLT